MPSDWTGLGHRRSQACIQHLHVHGIQAFDILASSIRGSVERCLLKAVGTLTIWSVGFQTAAGPDQCFGVGQARAASAAVALPTVPRCPIYCDRLLQDEGTCLLKKSCPDSEARRACSSPG